MSFIKGKLLPLIRLSRLIILQSANQASRNESAANATVQGPTMGAAGGSCLTFATPFLVRCVMPLCVNLCPPNISKDSPSEINQYNNDY
jgi:hypothetical protein